VREPLRVAAVQPACAARDVAGNAEVHAAAIRAAEAQVVVFPELSLTGYELDASSVAPDDPALTPIVDARAAMGSLALVGAPVADEQGRLFIAMLRIDADGRQIAYCKTWLGGREPARFTPGGGPATLDVDAYLAGLVHRPQELPEQEARAVVIARTCRAYVVFASFAGTTGNGFAETAGCSAIWSPEGLAIARAGPAAGDSARATLS